MAGASGHISSHKKLLQNYIRHAGAHNKIKEENEMWHMRHRELASDQSEYKLKSREERKRGVSVRSHRCEVPARSVCGGNMYQRELMKMKEADPTRWGHSGYKELYPEDFVSSESCGSEEEEEEEEECYGAHERAKARKHSVPDTGVSSHKKRRKLTKQKKSKKTKTEKELQEKEGRRKKKKKHKRHKRVAESPSSSQSSGHDKR